MTFASHHGVVIERRYAGKAGYASAAWLSVGNDRGYAGVTEAMLVEPIDFDEELAERSRTHEALAPVESDLRNTLFGV